MIPEIGQFALILAMCFASIQMLAPVFERDEISLAAAFGQMIFLVSAMVCLIASFLVNDITLLYVRDHSNEMLPILYRVGAAWGGHEGSLLLWCLILSAWTCALILVNKSRLRHHLPSFSAGTIFPKIIMILGVISVGFIVFLYFTSNPFARDFPANPIVSSDLTPVLQDPGLIFHPPVLYSGYVGFAIAFAFAVAALLEGKLDKSWAEACRPWVILPWAFLSVGIVLGSWWAYRELGWGGWWFWDPVENASLLPWLSATALLHALIVSEKRDAFKGWTILLAIVTFALSLIGTFLVRSGVLVSVHAFASDPTRGIFLLAYLALIIGGAFILYGARIKDFYQAPRFQLFSRETFLLMNSVFMIAAVSTILIGTLYPIILDALDLEKISVGEPYFNTVFIPIILPVLVLMGFAPHIKWGEESFQLLWAKIRWNLISSLVLALVLPWVFGFQFYLLTSIGVFAGLWIINSTLQYVYRYWHTHGHISMKIVGMVVAHVGIAILALGVTLTKSYSEERQVKIAPGETVSAAGYQFMFNNISEQMGPNYKSSVANFTISKNGDPIRNIDAEQRIYSHDQVLSKTGIMFNWWRDLYIALGNSFPNGAWSVRIYYKPFVRWIWFGGFMLLAGGLLSLLTFTRRMEE